MACVLERVTTPFRASAQATRVATCLNILTAQEFLQASIWVHVIQKGMKMSKQGQDLQLRREQAYAQLV